MCQPAITHRQPSTPRRQHVPPSPPVPPQVPDPVMSVALTPKSTDQLANFQKALQRFQKEDPTFHVKNDAGGCVWVWGCGGGGGATRGVSLHVGVGGAVD